MPLSISALGAAPIDESKLPPPATNTIVFAQDIKPIFEKTCLRCHGPERPKSGFRLDQRETALKGGNNGVDILPGQSGKSPLIHFVTRLVEDMEMPPVGKGEPLTPAEIGLLRAWIDQGVAWETNAPEPKFQMELAPTAGWVYVNGDTRKFREHYWMPDRWNGGVEYFGITNRLGPETKLTVFGHALLDDYKISLNLKKNNLGFTQMGWEQYRKYFDDTGGYYPGFDPAIFSLNRDLHLDVGRAWADFGLTLPHWPRMVLGYEYQYREGDRSTLQWGTTTQGGQFRNLYPAAKTVDERVHILKFDLNHDIKGLLIEDSFRGEFYDLRTERMNTRFYTVGAPGPSRVDDVREGYQYFQGANTLRLQKSLKDWLLVSGGYLYSQLHGDATFNLDTRFPIGPPGFADRWRAYNLVLKRETHTFNASTLLGPWKGLTLSAGVLSEWTHQEGLGQANQDLILPGGLALLTPFTFDVNQDKALVEEAVALRFTAIPYTVLFGEARLQQEQLGQFEQEIGGPHAYLQDTDATSNLRDIRAGFNTSPWQRLSLNGHYRRYEKTSDYNHLQDFSAHGEGYPAFIRWRDVRTDEAEAKLVLRPTSRLQHTFTYKYVVTDYRTTTDSLSLGAPSDISPGGRLDAAHYRAHIYSFNTTFTPWQRLYLTGGFSYQDTRMAAFGNQTTSLTPYRGDLWSVMASANCILSKTTDWRTTYSASWADYGQYNYADGLPLGIHYRMHALTTGLSRRLGNHAVARLHYGFYDYREPSAGGANNYTAHAVFGTLAFRLP